MRNLGAHYRGQEADLPPATRGDVDLRWVTDMLATDQRRHDGRPLRAERPVGERLQGCCRTPWTWTWRCSSTGARAS